MQIILLCAATAEWVSVLETVLNGEEARTWCRTAGRGARSGDADGAADLVEGRPEGSWIVGAQRDRAEAAVLGQDRVLGLADGYACPRRERKFASYSGVPVDGGVGDGQDVRVDLRVFGPEGRLQRR
jgi:hypothetical protein